MPPVSYVRMNRRRCWFTFNLRTRITQMMNDLRNALLEDEQLDVEPAPIPQDAALKNIAHLARRYTDLEGEIAHLEATLKTKKDEWRALREGALPLALTEVGMTKFTMTGGANVTLKTGYVASITEANRAAAHEWLEDHGHGSIIKHEIKIVFGKGEEAWARKFLRDLAKRKRPLRFDRKDTVHPQTLGAFVRETIAAAKAEGQSPEAVIPFPLLGVFELRYAEVEQPARAGGK